MKFRSTFLLLVACIGGGFLVFSLWHQRPPAPHLRGSFYWIEDAKVAGNPLAQQIEPILVAQLQKERSFPAGSIGDADLVIRLTPENSQLVPGIRIVITAHGRMISDGSYSAMSLKGLGQQFDEDLRDYDK